jgi:hypothetical protein
VFNRVRERVHNASGGRQVPWTVSSVIGDVYLRPGASVEGRPSCRRPCRTRWRASVTNSAAPAERPRVPDIAAGNAAYQRGDTEEAARVAQEVLRGDANNREALQLLAYVHFREQASGSVCVHCRAGAAGRSRRCPSASATITP